MKGHGIVKMSLAKFFLMRYGRNANENDSGVLLVGVFASPLNEGRLPMKNLFVAFTLSALVSMSAPAQGLIYFNNTSTTKISTNSIIGGGAAGLIAGAGNYRFALFYSTTATSVSGQTAAMAGNGGPNFNLYAFNDSAWQLAGYATNTTTAGRLFGDPNGIIVPGVAGGATVRFVVIGWSTSIGPDIPALMVWANTMYPPGGQIGQSAVSGPVTLGDGGQIPTPTVFGNIAPLLQGFTLGYCALEVDSPPTIITQPADVTVPVGGTATFSVTVGGTPGFCTWYFHGAIDNPCHGCTSLTITNVQLTNAGSYSAFIYNQFGSVWSSNAVLTVIGPNTNPPVILIQPAGVSAAVGDSATFAVTADGMAPLSYQWNFNGTNLPAATNNVLWLTNIQPANAGNYFVNITNAYGSTNSAVVALIVQTNCPPFITAQPQNLSVVSGASATFSVTAIGTPPLRYQWNFNGTNLLGATNSSLMIASVQPTNAGNYAVTVTNAYGSTNSASAELTIVPPSGGYVIFANNNNSATKIFTNSAVGGPVTGLTGTNPASYFYALFASATATSVSGCTNAIAGSASPAYAFNDPNWALVAYGKNTAVRGRLTSTSTDANGLTPVIGFVGGSTVQLVVVGWSANIGTDIAAVQNWFGLGDPVTDGWIGQSAVSGPQLLGDGGMIPALAIFGAAAPQLHGFTLGLASATPTAAYPLPAFMPAILQTKLSNGRLQLSWPAAAGDFGVQSALTVSGPWSDTGWTVTIVGTNATVQVPAGYAQPFFRLIVQ